MAPWASLTPMTAEWITMFGAVGTVVGDANQAVMSALCCASNQDVNYTTLYLNLITLKR